MPSHNNIHYRKFNKIGIQAADNGSAPPVSPCVGNSCGEYSRISGVCHIGFKTRPIASTTFLIGPCLLEVLYNF